MNTRRMLITSTRILTLAIMLAGIVMSLAQPLGVRAGAAPEGSECIDGYVWREAYPGDLTCVESWVRDQAWSDNESAATRIDPFGAYGKDSCIQGFVWREANPDDHVCVEPWVRDQTWQDNTMAAERTVAFAAITTPVGPRMQVWTNPWWAEDECTGDTCTTTSLSDVPMFEIGGDGYTDGSSVYVGIFRAGTDTPIWSQVVTARHHDGFNGGMFSVRSNVMDCSGRTRGILNVEVQAFDYTTGTWGDMLPLTACWGVL